LIYRICGLLIVLALIAAGLNGLTHQHFLFWCEAVAVWSFSISWLVKVDFFPFLADNEPSPLARRAGDQP